MINYDVLPDWLNRKLWTTALKDSGLSGTYFLEFDDQGDIISSRCLDPLGAWIPTSKFIESFKRSQQFNDFKNVDPSVDSWKYWDERKKILRSYIKDAIISSLSGIQWDVSDHEYLWRYESNSIYSIGQSVEVTVYHLNDEMSKSKGKNAWKKNPSKENCVIFKVDVEGWGGPNVPDWNPTGTEPVFNTLPSIPDWNPKAKKDKSSDPKIS